MFKIIKYFLFYFFFATTFLSFIVGATLAVALWGRQGKTLSLQLISIDNDVLKSDSCLSHSNFVACLAK